MNFNHSISLIHVSTIDKRLYNYNRNLRSRNLLDSVLEVSVVSSPLETDACTFFADYKLIPIMWATEYSVTIIYVCNILLNC